jgi:hypothetical protein
MPGQLFVPGGYRKPDGNTFNFVIHKQAGGISVVFTDDK